jgi:hypothetical protein
MGRYPSKFVLPPRSSLPLRILPQGSRGFYVRAKRASLPLHAPNMLAVRIQAIDGAGTFTLPDSRPCRLLPPWSAVFPPHPPPAVAHLCSDASQVLHRCTTPRRRTRGDYRSSLSPTGPHPSDCGRRLGLSVLARGASIHAWGLRLRRSAAHSQYRAPPYCLPVRDTPSASRISDFGAQFPSLHIPLSNASSAASRLPSHGSGPGWFATPFLYDSLIHYSTPVYPDANIPNLDSPEPCGLRGSRFYGRCEAGRVPSWHCHHTFRQ